MNHQQQTESLADTPLSTARDETGAEEDNFQAQVRREATERLQRQQQQEDREKLGLVDPADENWHEPTAQTADSGRRLGQRNQSEIQLG